MRKFFLLVVLGLLLGLGLNAQVKVDRGNQNYSQRTERTTSPRKSSQLSIKYGVKAGVNRGSGVVPWRGS